MERKARLLLTGGGVCVVLVVFALLGIFRSQKVGESFEGREATGLPLIGGPFQLIDKDGKIWKDSDFKGKPFLVYFGYTYCPDICPTALYTMSQAVQTVGGAKVIQPLFITIDPQRDTPTQLRNYTQKFLEDFILLTGSPAAILQATRAYHVHAARVHEEKESQKDYLMDHSSLIYLMGKKGEYIAHFNHQSSPSELVSRIGHYLKTGK